MLVMRSQNELDCESRRHVVVYSIVLPSEHITVELILQAPLIVSGEKWAVSGCISSPPTVSNKKEHF